MKPSFWSTKANANLDEGESGWNQEACSDVSFAHFKNKERDLRGQRVQPGDQLVESSEGQDLLFAEFWLQIRVSVPYTYT